MDYCLYQLTDRESFSVFDGLANLYYAEHTRDGAAPDRWSALRNLVQTHVASNQKTRALYVARMHDRVLGFGCLHPFQDETRALRLLLTDPEPLPGFDPTKTMVISEVVVHPEFRGKGIGTAIVRACKQYAKREGFEHLVLWSDRRSAPVVALSAKLGLRASSLYLWGSTS